MLTEKNRFQNSCLRMKNSINCTFVCCRSTITQVLSTLIIVFFLTLRLDNSRARDFPVNSLTRFSQSKVVRRLVGLIKKEVKLIKSLAPQPNNSLPRMQTKES